jgi:conflict system STAND superfamily ATPase
MSRKRLPLPVQILLFLLGTLLAVATGVVTNSTGTLPWGLEFLRRQSLLLAGVTVLLIIVVMIWQHRAEQHPALPARPVWDSDRSPFPGLEAFTEQDSAVFYGRDAEITELLERLHPVVAGQANRLVAVVGPSGAGKSSLVHAGVVPRLRQRRSGWIVVPPVVPGDQPLRNLARSLAAACPRHPIDNFLLAIAVQLLPPSERDRYLEEFRAELLDIPSNMRPSHALSLLRGVLVLRLRLGLKKEATDAAVRRAKGSP